MICEIRWYEIELTNHIMLFLAFINFILLKGKYEIIAIVNTQGIDKAKVTSHNK